MLDFKLPGAQIRGFGWKLFDARGTMRVRINFEACKIFFPGQKSLICFKL